MPTILVVDDSRAARMLISRAVTSLFPDHDILSAESGEKAIETLGAESRSFDFAILDYNMDGMDGLQLASQLLVSHPGCPLILCTANVQKGLASRAAELGVPVVPKPITKDKIQKITTELGVFK
jgi:two-component system, chemotaxis family, chemotaxis protein CheY